MPQPGPIGALGRAEQGKGSIHETHHASIAEIVQERIE